MAEEAGKKVRGALDYINFRAAIILMSVILPGFLILTELSLSLYFAVGGTISREDFREFVQETAHLGSPVVILALTFELAASVAIGFMAREVGFLVSDFLLNYHKIESVEFDQVLKKMVKVYGAPRVASATKDHFVFKLVNLRNFLDVNLISPELVSDEDFQKSLIGLGLNSPEFYVKNYCKTWLRTIAPVLEMDHKEAEINVFIAFFVPTALVSVPVLASGLSITTGCVAGLFIAAAFVLLVKINAERRFETWQIIANFVFAHWALEKFKQSVTERGFEDNATDWFRMLASGFRGIEEAGKKSGETSTP